MIKIFDKLWYIQKRHIPSTYDHKTGKYTYGELEIKKLSYMTYYEDNAPFRKRSETGVGWARTNLIKLDVSDGIIIDNSPVSGFKVVDSVSRWSTSNKLFRILDPRGFIVEIPTGNLATLLNYVTIVNAVILDDCVWGREGSNHVLLSVDSPPYAESSANMKQIKEQGFVKAKDLKEGDWVQQFNQQYDFYDYYYAGRCRLTWQNQHTKEIVVDSWKHLFIENYDGERKSGRNSKIKGNSMKITKVIRNETYDWFSDLDYYYAPQRVKNRFKNGTSHNEITSAYYGSRYVLDKMTIVKVETK